MNNYPPGSGNGRRRRFSWSYEEDHHIRQYSDENDLLSIDEFQYNEDQETVYENKCNENGDYDCETNGDNEMELCGSEDEHANDSNPQQPPHPHNNTNNESAVGRRRRRPLRKVLGKAWDIPSPTVMERRIQFRRHVCEETRRHRRILPAANNNMNNNAADSTVANRTNSSVSTNRNILQLLRDREVFGGGSSNGGVRKTTWAGQSFRNDRQSEFRIGVTIKTVGSNDSGGATTKQHRKNRRRNASRPLPPPPSNFSHRPITDELRTFAEQACVTRFESSYLTHLQHDDQPQVTPEDTNADDNGQSSDNTQSGTTNSDHGSNDSNADTNQNANIQQQQANTSSKAVSTISIAFSPDGKTMASTHGDHTVKITCCLTGALLQTLVGHPRTPWTVKYHPHAGANHSDSSMPSVVIVNNNNGSASTNSNVSSSAQETADHDDSSQARYIQQQYQQRQQIVASGCLGHQVRIWDWVSGTCLQMIRLEFAIISLSFHPSGSILAIANGTRLHFWGFSTITEANEVLIENETTESSVVSGEIGSNNNNSSSRYITNPGKHMHIDMRHMLRCVHFLPDGKKVIVGGVNNSATEFRRQRRLAAEGQQHEAPTMSFYLRLWDFDLEATRAPVPSPVERQQGRSQIRTVTPQDTIPESGANSSSNRSRMINNGNSTQQQSISESTRAAASAAAVANNMTGITTTRRRRYISNPRCFVPRALLYNDGGFDVSPDGKTLCACAEYWLPEGVDNATDLLHPPNDDDDDDDDDDDFVEDYSIGDSSSDSGVESYENDNDNLEMDDANGETFTKNNVSDVAKASNGLSVDNAKESDLSKKKLLEDDYTSEAGNPSAATSHVSPTPPQPSTSTTRQHQSSATPPRVFERQPRQISSPPLTLGLSATGSAIYDAPIPPIQAGITPQTPPPNVNPLNFPLSPPSPPGRRFAGGLNRGAPTPSSQQHEQLLQQYNRQQAMLHQHRHNHQQQEMNTPPPSSRGIENTNTTIPAPPGINHRNHRQQRIQTHQTTDGIFQKSGNPFTSTIRNSRDGANTMKKGRFVPHVVTISLDTEPYVETIVEERITGGPTLVSGDTASMTTRQQHNGSSRIRSTTVSASSNVGGAYSSNTTTFTKTTYNVPGKGALYVATKPHVYNRRPRLGQLLSACPLEPAKASAVTCVKFSPRTDFCLIGYGVRELHVEDENANDTPAHPPYHPVTAMYKVNKGGNMRHVSTMLSGDDDVNIARFHPDSGYGFVYGTKQGRIRILGPRPWNYYNC